LNRWRHDGRKSYPIPVWNGIFDHLPKIRSALAVFLWCIDRVTQEDSGVGFILGGSVVSVSRIAQEVHESERTVRRHLHRLATNGYLALKRSPYGFVIAVLNSRKFGIWRSDKVGHPERPRKSARLDNSADQVDELVRFTKEDSVVDSARRQDLPLNPQWGLTSRDRRKFFDELDRLCGASFGSGVDEELLIARACVRTGTPLEVAKEWIAASLGLEK
jgi:hypothetical protein